MTFSNTCGFHSVFVVDGVQSKAFPDKGFNAEPAEDPQRRRKAIYVSANFVKHESFLLFYYV